MRIERPGFQETLHATAGKISHELLGSVEVPLKNLPASGVRYVFHFKMKVENSKTYCGMCSSYSLIH